MTRLTVGILGILAAGLFQTQAYAAYSGCSNQVLEEVHCNISSFGGLQTTDARLGGTNHTLRFSHIIQIQNPKSSRTCTSIGQESISAGLSLYGFVPSAHHSGVERVEVQLGASDLSQDTSSGTFSFSKLNGDSAGEPEDFSSYGIDYFSLSAALQSKVTIPYKIVSEFDVPLNIKVLDELYSPQSDLAKAKFPFAIGNTNMHLQCVPYYQ